MSERNIHKCISCGLIHGDVEAGGVYHCPNPLCTVSGASWFKLKLQSYKDQRDHYTVDEVELLAEGLKYMSTVKDPAILHAIKESARKLSAEVLV